MKSRFLLSFFVAACLANVPCIASDFSGVELEEVVNLSIGGEPLKLRGSTVRSDARQAIYVGGLYLESEADGVTEIIQDEGAKRFLIYCQSSSIKPDALIRAFNLGLIANHSEAELAQLEPMVTQFNQLWRSEIVEGDKVWIDFVPELGTIVSINGEEKGTIPGKAFYDAFLKTWIGDKPINPAIKQQLLGES